MAAKPHIKWAREGQSWLAYPTGAAGQEPFAWIWHPGSSSLVRWEFLEQGHRGIRIPQRGGAEGRASNIQTAKCQVELAAWRGGYVLKGLVHDRCLALQSIPACPCRRR
jgi:hypothetical protein